jgi:hypothetical protein
VTSASGAVAPGDAGRPRTITPNPSDDIRIEARGSRLVRIEAGRDERQGRLELLEHRQDDLRVGELVVGVVGAGFEGTLTV